MKILLFAGLLLVVLGIASLVVPIPRSETQGIKVGDTNIGVQTSHVTSTPASTILSISAWMKSLRVRVSRTSPPAMAAATA